ncbi:MAG: hypothetical protein ACR2J9_03605 [Gaiellales bacterium]
MRGLLIGILALGLLVPAAASAGTVSSYTCDPTYASYTGCAVIKNEVETWTAPGVLTKRYPLVFASVMSVYLDWKAQEKIPSGGTGDAIFGNSAGADGAIIYSYRPVDLRQNYQALVGFRLSDRRTPEGCIEMSYLNCEMGPQLETRRDSKHVFTVTSRPLEVRLVNALPQAIKRVDGPYWSNALAIDVADNAGRIEPSKTASAGALRSIKRTSAYAAIYKFVRSTTEARYNGSTIAISISVTAAGARTGQCTPIFPPSGTRFTCRVDFSGSDSSTIATVRVQPA